MKRNLLIVLPLILFKVSCQTIPPRYFSDVLQGSYIILEKPDSRVHIDLIKALQLRKSTKYFSEKEISIKVLSTILWSANGINRKDGKRTAPSPFGKELVNVYVFSNFGIYLYDFKRNTLLVRSNKKVNQKG